MFDSPIQEIKDRLPILGIVQDFVQLRKAGTNYKGICPFHSEKSPSFMVSPSKQIWHCFGCGLGGDIFEFIKLMEHVEFPEALKILADRAGVELKKPTPEQIQIGKTKDVLYEINQKAAEYFAKVLWESNAGSEALAYLRQRGLSDPTIKNWQLGFAPDDFHYLENYLAKSFDRKDIEQAGLIIKSEKDSGYFDRFHDRVMFPIANLHGQVVGFTGRLLHDKPNTGKYVNSPETPIYNKSQVIYGLFAGKNQIRKENRAIVVEGNMDVIACHQAGFIQTVATSGTALTDQQLMVLKRFCENLIFAFDSDQAGTAATKRALELALHAGFNVKIANLGGAKDPDELIKRGIGLWEKAVNNAGSFVDFFFDHTFAQFDPTKVESKREITKELAPLIFRMNDPVTKAHYVRKLATNINVAETAIWDIINKLTVPKSIRSAAQQQAQKPKMQILEDQVLGLSLLLRDFQYLKDLGLSEILEDNRKELLIFSAETDMNEQQLDAKVELPKIAAELKKLITKEQMLALTEKISLAEQKKDKQLLDELTQEYVTLSKQVSKS
ncbi:MAG: DNA primase [Candidatus Doudnabacteria bacterium RIFCSPHIGHO2_01_FULL_45_18]|uniref:DNA primase n=1 Tax=Candidatus Doudnabacteria bacterium RIFCSPHIGHO2_01_FULL_45_18 TaxID=1817823 RepID=A0A1F5NRU6_9BACT|nr:MAG: DNA primase [Candidatus Doudnabacteria bacterium RIFCSPHIGHO2_01_FULL_45_18]